MKKSSAIRNGTRGPWGDSRRHLPLAELERGFAELSPPEDDGELALLVSRADDGARNLVDRVALSVEAGMPDDGCSKFRQRFGGDALRLTAAKPFRDLRLLGIYLRVVETGGVAVGDAVEVVSRA